MQCSNYDKMRKALLFSSVPTNLFPFLTKESQNKIQTFLSENALNKGFTEESLDFSKVGILQKMNNISNQAREIIYKEIIATQLKMI